jgi:hypothetical protein
MTDPTPANARVRCSAGHWHRRYPRWSEVDPSVRLPEGQWQWRWRLDDRCAVAVANPLESQMGRFQPCRRRPASGLDVCRQHAQLERRVSGRISTRGGGPGCQAPLLASDTLGAAGAEVDE